MSLTSCKAPEPTKEPKHSIDACADANHRNRNENANEPGAILGCPFSNSALFGQLIVIGKHAVDIVIESFRHVSQWNVDKWSWVGKSDHRLSLGKNLANDE